MKIYTRGGDDGQTGLLGGQRVSKSDLQIEAIGNVDELNASLGWARARCPVDRLSEWLAAIQHELFSIGAFLAATDQDSSSEIANFLSKSTKRLESEIDELEKGLAELRHFILPGGHESAAALHVCRTICRRAERSVVKHVGSTPNATASAVTAYLNRLSDWLFVSARFANCEQNREETIWKKPY